MSIEQSEPLMEQLIFEQSLLHFPFFFLLASIQPVIHPFHTYIVSYDNNVHIAIRGGGEGMVGGIGNVLGRIFGSALELFTVFNVFTIFTTFISLRNVSIVLANVICISILLKQPFDRSICFIILFSKKKFLVFFFFHCILSVETDNRNRVIGPNGSCSFFYFCLISEWHSPLDLVRWK